MRTRARFSRLLQSTVHIIEEAVPDLNLSAPNSFERPTALPIEVEVPEHRGGGTTAVRSTHGRS
ncbi:hypothetical protein, partial [Mycobacterium tuberculosis]|uniref:hypothetical protein n=1 Tax=Mycobacterium tuberculosis TaxID=1773 RepID=UPI001AE5A3BD|nr:hypothetical protein [Mycobacterium tuberculosis]